MKGRYAILAFVLFLAAACSSTTPTNPTPNPPVDPGPVVNNTPPVIGAFTVLGTRTNEPPNFADVLEAVPVNVVVTDAESPVSALKFNWSGDLGTFTGSGPNVTWTAPATISGPTTVTLHLEVVETYTSQGKSIDNRVNGSTTISLHNSAKEVGDMAVQFLNDFSDSSITDLSVVMKNFQPGCYGTQDETAQVAQNRIDFKIIGHTIGDASTTINFGGVCPYRSRPGDACAQVPSYWKSQFARSFTDNDGVFHSVGELTAVNGTDQVAAMYYKDLQRWRLCDSAYNGYYVSTLRRTLLRSLTP